MELFPALAIIIVIIVIIIIVITIIVVVSINANNNPTNGTCSSQTDCQFGFVCVYDLPTNTNRCKAGLGISCNSDTDCIPELACVTTPGSSNKICQRRDTTLSTSIPQTKPISTTTRRRIRYSRPVVNEQPPIQESIIITPEHIPVIEPEPIVELPAPIIVSAYIPNIQENITIPSNNKVVTFDSCTPLSSDTTSNIDHGKYVSQTTDVSYNEPNLSDINNEDFNYKKSQISSNVVDHSILTNNGRKSQISSNLVDHNILTNNGRKSSHTNKTVIKNKRTNGELEKLISSPCTPLSFDLPNTSIRSTSMSVSGRDNVFIRDDNTPLSFDTGNRTSAGTSAGTSAKISTRTSTVKIGSSNIITSSTRKPTQSQPVKIGDPPIQEEVKSYRNSGTKSLRRNIDTDITTIDNEINSGGTRTDIPFDIRSGESTGYTNDRKIRDSVGNNGNYISAAIHGGTNNRSIPVTERSIQNNIALVSTPCEEKNGVYYCRSDKPNTINPIDSDKDHSPVIDVCSYSDVTVFLLQDNNVICETKDNIHPRYRAINNIKLNHITSFAGYLYGIGVDRKLYTLPNSYFHATNWLWNSVDWAPTDIIHISCTHDSSSLWIQTVSTGYMYNGPGSLMFKTSYIGMKRVYGRNSDHYIDIDHKTNSATIYPGGSVVKDVYDGALSYYDEVVAIHPSEREEFRAITIVNWRPYYIRV